MKKIILILWLLILGFSASIVFAQDLTLTRIGTLSTVGIDYSNVTYTGAIPTLAGTASPSAIVYIKIKTSTDATTAASPSGNWQFTPGVMDPGPNPITITSGSQSLAFILTFNATPAATPTPTAEPTPEPTQLPQTGEWEYYIPVIGMGIVVFFFGKFLKDRMMAWEGKKKW